MSKVDKPLPLGYNVGYRTFFNIFVGRLFYGVVKVIPENVYVPLLGSQSSRRQEACCRWQRICHMQQQSAESGMESLVQYGYSEYSMEVSSGKQYAKLLRLQMIFYDIALFQMLFFQRPFGLGTCWISVYFIVS